MSTRGNDSFVRQITGGRFLDRWQL